jgi:hypothetical protein
MLIQPSKAVRKKDPIKKDTALARANLTRWNIERFQVTLSYFSHLNATGEISDKSYEALVRYACAIFIETEIEEMVQNSLKQKIDFFLMSKNLRIDNLLSESKENSLNLDISRFLKSR